ncbi:CDGSH iron-sulfur domain-containing protein [Aliiroseovarius sp. S2029]|uniref:CDGSH iron-sulfur domain-containing protein n=1 Tax=Aliiroseovarius sp. S2029 TaxID=2936988 RepID=UPI0020C0AC76|nr:CDGSH iron-sulfur domain-containing protein [Aliiroseovarius sp. S2029]MCK8483108.1 CDGSH iron-sulfur domain-containing protein [Aliiroseovarius sp. S2029]
MKRKEYSGQDITVGFDLGRCIHSRNCFLQLPKVFDPNQRPWVQPEQATVEDVAAVVRACPSGALTYRRKDGRNEQPPQINKVAVLENGPLVMAGDLSVEGGETQTRVALCRCGLSKNKPYCDNSHVDAGFVTTGEPAPKVPPSKDAQEGAVNVDRQPDGPLKVAGNIELCTGTGKRIAKLGMAYLCRCGQSKNKPFCDGSHKDAGFKDSAE